MNDRAAPAFSHAPLTRARRTLELYDRWVLGGPGRTLLLLAAVFGFLLSSARDFRLDASGDSLVLENDADLRYYRDLVRRYKTREFVFVTYTPTRDGLFTDRGLDGLRKLREDLSGLEGVESVTTLLDVPLLQNPPVPISELRANLKTLEDEGVDRKLAVEEFRESPLYRELLVSPDLRSTALQVNFKPFERFESLTLRRQELRDLEREGRLSTAEAEELRAVEAQYFTARDLSNEERHRGIEAVRRVIARHSDRAVLRLGGVPMIADDIIMFIRSDLNVFGLGMFLLLVFTQWLIFRRKRWIILPLCVCSMSVFMMMGLLGLIGWEVTVVSANFVSMQLIFTMSLCIHVVSRYRQLLLESPHAPNRELIKETVHGVFVPNLYSTLTMVAGFATLPMCDILPVVNFGYMMVMGTLLTMLVTYLFLPPAMMLLPKPPPDREQEFGQGLIRWFARLTERRGGVIYAVSAGLLVATAVGMTRLEVENSFIDYFQKDTEIYQGMAFIDQELGGTTPLEIVLKVDAPVSGEAAPAAAPDDEFSEFEEAAEEGDAEKYWYTPAKLEKIERVHDYLDALPATGKVLSLATLSKIGRQINRGPLDEVMTALIFRKMPEDFKDLMVRPYASVERGEARLTVRIRDSLPGLRRDALIKKIREELVRDLGLKEDEFRVTGLMLLYNNMLQSLFRSQILTGWTSTLMIVGMFVLLFRSVKLSFLTILPSLLSCLSVLGIMGLLGLPLDIMTITIVAISMGIAVEDTIHYVHRFQEEFPKDHDYVQTMYRCHQSIGNAMFYTSLTVIVGFSILALSNFIPSVLFGLLTAFAMAAAIIAAQTLLPRLMLTLQPFGPDRSRRRV